MLGASLNSYIYPIIYEVQQAMTAIKDWVGLFLRSIFNQNGALHGLEALFVIGIAIAAIFVSIVIIKKVVWGK